MSHAFSTAATIVARLPEFFTLCKCVQLREQLQQLRGVVASGAVSGLRWRGPDDIESVVKCQTCNDRCWLLTEKGIALTDALEQLWVSAEPAKKEEIPF